MARKVILETGYTFDPANKKITIPRVIPRERLVLISNVTRNIILFNFTDANLKATGYVVNGTVNSGSTEITLQYDTTSHSVSDKLSIVIDEYEEKFLPGEAYVDPVNKFRVSQPQALIDTDFEYGTQITKWENLAMINNRPFAFSSPTDVGTINSIQFANGSKTVTVGLAAAAPSVGTPISVTDTYLIPANGNFLVESVSGAGSTIFTYTASSVNTTNITNIFDPNKTGIASASLFTGARIGTNPVAIQTSISGIVTFFTSVPHGLAIGNNVAIRNVTATANPPNGSFSVVGIVSARGFSVATQNVPNAPNAVGEIYVIPQGQVLHRPFDGGVIFSSNANANFETQVRQTRRYFRYQSGKGLQVSSGTILKPNLQVDSITSVGVAASVITKEQHNIQPGTQVTIVGCGETHYNGTFTITDVKGYNNFEYTMTGAATSTTASGSPYVSVSGWYGAANRLGIFDEQNGMFFEFDGQQLYAVRRNSTFQLSGKVTVTNGSNTITQTNSSFPTYFSKQLQIGNFIVLRGQSYRVIDIASDTSLTISPSYRGANADYVIASKTVDTKTPQSQWNIDKLDGTGPSGMNLDLGKMQMWYIDYSWYGAGFIRYGVRGQTGDVIYCHKVANNNVNTEAYMRSGNLPARYESQALPPTTQINRTIGSAETFIGVNTTAGFPPTGTLVIRDAEVYEYVNYAGIGTTAFTGVTRAKAGAAVNVTVSANSNKCTSVGSTANLQVGMRAVHPNLPDGTWISQITGTTTLTLSQASTGAIAGVAVTFVPMGAATPQTFTYNANGTNPVGVELAFPTFGPTISHWGTSVIMDGRFDDDKSLVFTYGQTGVTTVTSGSTRALFSIRVAPSIDNGKTGVFGARELINRMQLTLKSLDITSRSANTNVLIQAYLNAVPSTATNWTNAVGNVGNRANSSLAQIADYAGGSTTVTGGEVTAGFFVGGGASSIDLSNVRDLGNSILGGGGLTANSQIYPDGPDTLTIVATNLRTQDVELFSRLSWTEAQA
jgi:hypothetical protein